MWVAGDSWVSSGMGCSLRAAQAIALYDEPLVHFVEDRLLDLGLGYVGVDLDHGGRGIDGGDPHPVAEHIAGIDDGVDALRIRQTDARQDEGRVHEISHVVA